MKRRILGTYKFKHFVNKGKIEKVKEIFKKFVEAVSSSSLVTSASLIGLTF